MSSPLVTESVSMGSALFLHSLAWCDLPVFVLDSLHLGLAASLQSLACLGSTPSAFGMARADSIFVLSVMHGASLGFILFLRGFLHCGLAPSAPDYLRLGFFVFLQQSARFGFCVLTFGKSCVEFFLPIPDPAHFGFSLLARSSSRSESLLFAANSAQLSSPMLARSPARLGFGALMTGICRLGFVFVLPVVDTTKLGFFLLLRSFA